MLNLKETKIISAFPACGKSYYYEKYNSKDFVVLDSDSSHFSWVKDENGDNTDVRNPLFPNNYINHIKSNLGKADIIFVSSHEVVLDALEDNSIEYSIVTPTIDLKEEWLKRFVERGNNEGFISFLSKNFENFVKSLQERNANIVALKSEQFIEDVMPSFSKKNEM